VGAGASSNKSKDGRANNSDDEGSSDEEDGDDAQRLRRTNLGRSKPSANGRKERSAKKVPWQTALPMRTPQRPETLNVYWPEIRILPNYGYGTSTNDPELLQ
jgi:hypothetical protein